MGETNLSLNQSLATSVPESIHLILVVLAAVAVLAWMSSMKSKIKPLPKFEDGTKKIVLEILRMGGSLFKSGLPSIVLVTGSVLTSPNAGEGNRTDSCTEVIASVNEIRKRVPDLNRVPDVIYEIRNGQLSNQRQTRFLLDGIDSVLTEVQRSPYTYHATLRPLLDRLDLGSDSDE